MGKVYLSTDAKAGKVYLLANAQAYLLTDAKAGIAYLLINAKAGQAYLSGMHRMVRLIYYVTYSYVEIGLICLSNWWFVRLIYLHMCWFPYLWGGS